MNTRNLIDYIAPHGNVRSSFILTTPENGHCANKATFFAGYGKDLYRKDGSLDAPEGPLMDATSIGRETLLPYGSDLPADSYNTTGPRSYVGIELTTYTFHDERGRPDCLSARHVEEDLLADGWKETSSLFSDTDKENGRGSKILVFPNTRATIRLSIEAYTPNRCLLNIGIQSLDPSVR